jgi:uncharacterized protein (TIGR02271 family)
MSGTSNIRAGMAVYGSDEQLIGTVDGLGRGAISVNGQEIAADAIARVAQDRVYLKDTGARLLAMGNGRTTATAAGRAMEATSTAGAEGELHVPVAEERLSVGKQGVELGEVEVRKTVETERVSIPVELMREEVTVQQRDITDRRLSAAETADAFQGGTMRLSVRGEEAVVTKAAIVTGEVVIDKERMTERQTVTDTVRKEQVTVDEQTYQTGATATSGQRTSGRTVESATTTRRAPDEHVQPAPAPARTSADDSGAWADLKEDVREGFDKVRGQ